MNPVAANVPFTDDTARPHQSRTKRETHQHKRITTVLCIQSGFESELQRNWMKNVVGTWEYGSDETKIEIGLEIEKDLKRK